MSSLAAGGDRAILTLAAQAAEEKPLWEVGAGVAAFSFPAYRGSDETNNFLMPVPLFSYHGDFFKADRHGIRAAFLDSDKLDLTFSMALSPPAACSPREETLPESFSIYPRPVKPMGPRQR